MRWSALVLVAACGGEGPKPAEPVVASVPLAMIDAPVPIAPADATVAEIDVDEPPPTPWTGPVPPKPEIVQMAPGIHPVLVRTDALKDRAAFFLLGCSKLEPGKPTKFLDGKACAPLLGNVQLELVLEKTRVPVRVTGRGTSATCPWVNDAKAPIVMVAGLPKQEVYGDIVSKDTTRYEGPVDPDVLKAIRKVTPLTPTKRPNAYGPHPSNQIDLDGDGKYEVIMSMEGSQLYLFTSDGTLVSSVGCYLG